MDVSKPIEIFISYAHEDLAYVKELQKRLKPLERNGLIQQWSYANISAGTNWNEAIGTHLNTAQVILLLISDDFMASDYCYSVEMQQAMERHDKGEAKVIPIILRPTYAWKSALFGKLQALPTDAKPIKKWRNKDDAFVNVIENISKTAESFSLLLSANPQVLQRGEQSIEPSRKGISPEQKLSDILLAPITPNIHTSKREGISRKEVARGQGIKRSPLILISFASILCIVVLFAMFGPWSNHSSLPTSSKSASSVKASQLSTNPTTTVDAANQPTPLATLTSPSSTTTKSASLASVKNLNIPCNNISDGRNPAQTNCKADFPLSLTLNSIDFKQHPTVWNFTLIALPSGQELSCSGVQFTNVQLTDTQGNIYSASGYKGPWSLNTTQSQQVSLTFDIPKSGNTFQLNVSIHNCHYYTTYQTLSLSA